MPASRIGSAACRRWRADDGGGKYLPVESVHCYGYRVATVAAMGAVTMVAMVVATMVAAMGVATMVVAMGVATMVDIGRGYY